ncbi:MAG: hypothetical protein HUJ98_04695 [Bacteroidaceae bacterium]|nr:hypothetical protein [Bacteroidaceae bacterium]
MRKSLISYMLTVIMSLTLAFSFSQDAYAAGKAIREKSEEITTETTVEVEEISVEAGDVVMISDEEVPLAIYDDPITDGIYIPIIGALCALVMVMGGAILVFTRKDDLQGR